MEKRQRHRVVIAQLRIFLLCVCVGGLLLTGCSGDDDDATTVATTVTPAALTPGIIRGQVIRGDTQKPQQGLTVTVEAIQSKTTTTDANGRFEVKDLEVNGGAGHLVTLKDDRVVGTAANQIPTAADRLATQQFRIGIGATADNTQSLADVGVVTMNPGGSINVLVTLATGTPVPDNANLTVAAVPVGLNGACAIGVQARSAPTPATIPSTATTGAGGRAVIAGLDSCITHTVVVPAQIVAGIQQAGAAVADVEIVQGEAQVIVRLVPAIPDTALAVLAGNLLLPPGAAFTTVVLGVPGFQGFAASTNVHNSPGVVFPMSNPMLVGAPIFFTAPSGAGNLIIVFNQAITLEGDVRLLFRNELIDPDVNDDVAGLDNLAGEIRVVLGTTTSLDTTGTILTIAVPAPGLVANQYYTLAGTVRGVRAAASTNLNTLGGGGMIYVADNSAATGDLSTAGGVPGIITADNRSGNGGVGPAAPSLVFREAVAGTGLLVSTSVAGVITQAVNPVQFTISPATTTRLVSTNGDPAAPNPAGNAAGTCVAGCLGGATGVADTVTQIRVVIAIPGAPVLSNGDGVTVELDVVDLQGNRFTGRLSLTVQ